MALRYARRTLRLATVVAVLAGVGVAISRSTGVTGADGVVDPVGGSANLLVHYLGQGRAQAERACPSLRVSWIMTRVRTCLNTSAVA